MSVIEPASQPTRPSTRAGKTLQADLSVADVWAAVASAVQRFGTELGASPADIVVLLPLAHHLPPARAAWATLQPNGWMPRFETTRTLAESLAAMPQAQPGAPCFDADVDRLQAMQMLADAVPDWSRRDARGFALAVRRVVDLTHSLAAARTAQPPTARSSWITAARERLAGSGAPAAAERVLAGLALEWSLSAPTDAADALFAHRPAAWVGLRAGGCDALTEALLAAADSPTLWLDAERGLSSPPTGEVVVAACSDFESEAQRTAAAVLALLRQGDGSRAPVALIALDRLLVRRVRALLERQHVTLADETGWKLSTTRAAARVASMLRAAGHHAGTDELLDFLKSLPGTAPGGRWTHGIDALEAVLRTHAWTGVTQVDRARLPLAARSGWDLWLRAVEPLRELRRTSLAQWLARMTEALRRCELLEALTDDSAGLQVLAALRCAPPDRGRSPNDSILLTVAASTQFTASAFVAWVDDVLEQAIFMPPVEATAQVVILPLARARLRPFSAVVCPGADAAHLGAGGVPDPLLGDALAVALGVAGVAARQEAERKAFAQLARASRLTLLYRCAEGAEPMTASPLLLRGQLAAARRGLPWAAAPDERELRSMAPRPTPRPRPSAPALLPERYSASRYEHLRACPYRFYALAVLRLDDPQELDDELEKREVGSWLHAVMQRFHDERVRDSSPEADLAALHGVAADEIVRRFGGGAAVADFLPFEAWFEAVAPAYVTWLHEVQAEGWSVQASELELRAVIVVGEGATSIHGRLDRVDRLEVGPASGGEPGEHRRLIDYKLKNKTAVQGLVRLPLEDTQLAFYAALLGSAEGWPSGGIEAGYLALDGRDSVAWVPHAEVADSAQALLEGLAHDVTRLRDGAPMPALGDGAACDHCAARGLCRRDHWGPA